MQRSRLDDSAPGRRKTRDASRAHAVRICATGLAPTLLRAPFLVLTATCSPRPCGKAVDRSIAGRADSAVVVGRFNTPAMPEPSAKRRGLIVRQIIFWHQFCSPMLQNLRSQAMRLRSSMLALLTAAVFCAPATAPAMQLTVSIDGIFLSGLGLCTDIPAAFGGCIDLATLPIGINPDNGLPYDQVSLAATGPVTVDIAVPGSETFDQPWVFIPGDTGGASYSSDYHFFFDLDRNITISDGIQSITQT
ncbi:MAG TPA: hypothetical protein VMK05_12135, partial [Burkholderiales bacterium]|nr:hypothetical protein [Burkholderiales bacterium]